MVDKLLIECQRCQHHLSTFYSSAAAAAAEKDDNDADDQQMVVDGDDLMVNLNLDNANHSSYR